MASPLLRNYESSRAGTSSPFPIGPRLTSQKHHRLSSVQLDCEQQPACETPKFTLETYRLCINTGKNFQLDLIRPGKLDSEQIFAGNFSLFEPDEYIARWHQTIDFIQLDFDLNSLIDRAQTLTGKAKVELMSHFSQPDPAIYQMGLALQSDLQTGQTRSGSPLYAETIANAMMLHLIRHYGTAQPMPSTPSSRFSDHKLDLVIDYIQANLTKDIHLPTLAAIAQMGESHFARQFKQATNVSPYQYVIQQRIEMAQRLLHQRKLSISEIALTCGFNHQSHLNRHFKRITGVTPYQFRKNI